MGPIFSEYLFVRFFQRDNEKKEGIYWAEAKMDELLMQLRHYLEPDKNIVTKSKYLLFCLMSVFHVFMSVFHVYYIYNMILDFTLLVCCKNTVMRFCYHETKLYG